MNTDGSSQTIRMVSYSSQKERYQQIIQGSKNPVMQHFGVKPMEQSKNQGSDQDRPECTAS
ncbi:hypothetical protein D3C74_476280 [compost metagenome]